MTNQNFDFAKIEPVKTLDLENFSSQKKSQFKEQIITRSNNKLGQSWIIVSVLLLSVIGLAAFTLSEAKKNNQIVNELKSKNSVAGASGANNFTPITGHGFSILPEKEPPSNFNKQKNSQDSPFLEGRKAIVTSFLSTEIKESKELKSGMEIAVVEYDNKLSQNDFAKLVSEKLGADYQLKSNQIQLPKDVKATVIEPIENKDLPSYYVVVTSDNYYTLKIFNQTSNYSEFTEISRFTDTILQSLYLN